MSLETELQSYELKEENKIGEIYTNGLEMYSGIGPCSGSFRSSSSIGGLSFGAPSSMGGDRWLRSARSCSGIFKEIDSVLDGGLKLRLDKSTKTTYILTEKLGCGEILNTYIHHDRGPGRMEEINPYDSILKDFKKRGII